jgi:hypothetical protein
MTKVALLLFLKYNKNDEIQMISYKALLEDIELDIGENNM